jgi:hypothetical protein
MVEESASVAIGSVIVFKGLLLWNGIGEWLGGDFLHGLWLFMALFAVVW